MTSHWFLEQNALTVLARARERYTNAEHAAAWEAAEAREDERRVEARELPRIMSVAGSHAEIRVEGVLTKKPDFFSMFFGGGNTTYPAIRHALGVAASDPDIRTIVFNVDSPGGAADGLIELLDAIHAVRTSSGKSMRVRADYATSAAFGLSAAVGNIEATARGSTFGSIGTAIAYYVEPNVVTLTNTASPDKRPDLTTDAGKAVVVKYLDQVNDEFVRAIARGRGVEASTVLESYGRGALFTAPHALKLGMIDKISATPPLRAVSKRKTSMNGNDDETRASAAELTAAETRGRDTERDRVLAHLTMGESSGDMTIALEAIRSGASMTQELSARYMSAALNRRDKTERQTETNAAAAATAGAGAKPPVSQDLGDRVVALIEQDRSFVRG